MNYVIVGKNIDVTPGLKQAVEEKIGKLTEELAEAKQTESDAENWIALIKKYSEPEALDAALLNTLIEKIVVHEAETDEFGVRTQNVEIYYRFVGKIE